MDAQQNRIKSLTYDHPDQIPVSISILPAAWMRHREALDEVVASHPSLFGAYKPGERDYDAVGGTYVSGEHVDVWGCV